MKIRNEASGRYFDFEKSLAIFLIEAGLAKEVVPAGVVVERPLWSIIQDVDGSYFIQCMRGAEKYFFRHPTTPPNAFGMACPLHLFKQWEATQLTPDQALTAANRAAQARYAHEDQPFTLSDIVRATGKLPELP